MRAATTQATLISVAWRISWRAFCQWGLPDANHSMHIIRPACADWEHACSMTAGMGHGFGGRICAHMEACLRCMHALPASGEGNRDGSNDNFSWNCGCEGETDDTGVNALRARQIRNLHLALMVSQGMPMVLMGALPLVLPSSSAPPGSNLNTLVQTMHLQKADVLNNLGACHYIIDAFCCM